MPGVAKLTGDPKTGIISGKIMFQFDDDFQQMPDPADPTKLLTLAQSQQAYISMFRNNIMSFWNNRWTYTDDTGASVCIILNDGTEDTVQFCDYTAADPGWAVLVGQGAGTLSAALFSPTSVTATQWISYVQYTTATGFMFQQRQASEAAHEFGHMVRLSDRYVNGVNMAGTKPWMCSRFTPPMSPCFTPELALEGRAAVNPYRPDTNLMAMGSTILTNRQLSFVLSDQQEPRYLAKANGWVPMYSVLAGQGRGEPVWLRSNGLGFSYELKADVDQGIPCDMVSNPGIYKSLLPQGKRGLKCNQEYRRNLAQLLVNFRIAGPPYLAAFMQIVKELSAMNR